MLNPHSARRVESRDVTRDAQNERDGAGLRSSVAAATAATPSQLRRSSAAHISCVAAA